MFDYFRNTFRIWWQKPRTSAEFHIAREVSFLELFYDLVFVVLISQSAHFFSHHLSVQGLLQYVFLFLFIFWTWINGVRYHSLHGQNDISTRVFTFVQMILVAVMTVFVGIAFGAGAVGFAISIGLFYLFFAFLWLRTGYFDQAHRRGAYPLALTYLLTSFIFFSTVFVSPPINFYLWGVSILGSMLIPFFLYLMPSSHKVMVQSSKINSDTVERLGLITIIALGEVIVSSINGIIESEVLALRVFLIGFLGMLIAIGLWWIYFDFVSRRSPKEGFGNSMRYVFLHIPLVMGIAAIGALVREMIVHYDHLIEPIVRWFWAGSVGLVIIVVGMLLGTIYQQRSELERYVVKGRKIVYLIGVFIFCLGFSDLGSLSMLFVIFVLLIVPVIYGVGAWVRVELQRRG